MCWAERKQSCWTWIQCFREQCQAMAKKTIEVSKLWKESSMARVRDWSTSKLFLNTLIPTRSVMLVINFVKITMWKDFLELFGLWGHKSKNFLIFLVSWRNNHFSIKNYSQSLRQRNETPKTRTKKVTRNVMFLSHHCSHFCSCCVRSLFLYCTIKFPKQVQWS